MLLKYIKPSIKLHQIKFMSKTNGQAPKILLAQPGATQRSEFNVTGSQFVSVGGGETERRGRGRRRRFMWDRGNNKSSISLIKSEKSLLYSSSTRERIIVYKIFSRARRKRIRSRGGERRRRSRRGGGRRSKSCSSSDSSRRRWGGRRRGRVNEVEEEEEEGPEGSSRKAR